LSDPTVEEVMLVDWYDEEFSSFSRGECDNILYAVDCAVEVIDFNGSGG